MTNRYGSLTLQIKALSNLADVGSAYTDTLISASGTQELSKIGRGSFTVSIRAYALLTAVASNIGQVAYVYITDQVASGAAMDVAAFIIQDINKSTDGTVTVSGPDILHQLIYTTLDANVIDDGAGGPDTTDIDDIMAYAASGWTNTGGNSTNGTYYPANGNNVMEALIAAAKQNGEMFRLSAMSPPAKTVQWLTSADSSGVTLRMPATPTDYDASTTTGIILSMSENLSIGQVVTRVKPHGAGLRDGRLNIRNIDSGDTGGDPAGYTTYFNTTFPNTIVNDTLESALGYIIKQDVDFSHITAEDVTDATQLTSAAVALWREGLNFLQERDSSNKVYDVECIVPYDLRPGQNVTIVYTEYEGGITGGNAVWSVNDSFTIHQVTNSVGNTGDLAGVRITTLTVGESIVPRVSGASEIASALRTSRETTRKATPATAPGYIPSSRTLTTTQPLRINGGAAADLSADRTLTVNGLSTIGSANQIPGTNSGATAWEYKTLTNGTGINITHGAGTITVTNTDPAAGLSGLAFVTIGNTASLSAERALTAGDGIDLTDAGANSTVTLAVDVTDILGNGLTESSNNIVLGTPSTLTVSTSNGVSGTTHTHAITSSSNPGAAASILASDSSGYLTLQRLKLPNNTGYVWWPNAAATDTGGYLSYSSADDMLITTREAGSVIYLATRNIADSADLTLDFQDGGSGVSQLNMSGAARLSSGGDLTLLPNAGDDLIITLSTTGDLLVNTDQLVVDTSADTVSVGGVLSTGRGTGTANFVMNGAAGNTRFQYFRSAGSGRWGIGANNTAEGGSDAGSNFQFTSYTDAGSSKAIEMMLYRTGGVTIGQAPTGGAKGNGTLNLSGDIYKNNTAYTSPDYALEMWRDGRIDQFADNPGADTYRRLSLAEIKRYIVDNLRLPGFSDQPAGIFERGDLVLEKLEEIFTFLIDHEERLEAIGG